MEDFIASNAGWIIILIVALVYPAKLLFRMVSSKLGIKPVVSDAIVDKIAKSSTDAILSIKEQKRESIILPLDINMPMLPGKPINIQNESVTPSLNKDGFRMIKQPSNPNNYTNNGEMENEKAKDNSDSDKSDDPDRSMQL